MALPGRGSPIANRCHPREVMKPVILASAYAFILAHNHPSGYTDPSAADNQITRTVAAAGELMGVRLLDHVIISDRAVAGRSSAYSFRQAGMIR